MKLIVFGVLFVVLSAGLASSHVEPEVPALFVFGDSLMDVGNNMYLHICSAADFLPYGIDYPGCKPTGRFSNGYNSADYIAKMLGFKESPPAYFSFINNNPPLPEDLQGANFASAGSGILDITLFPSITMRQQINYFGLMKGNMSDKLGPVETDRLLSKSIFVISAGSNDMLPFVILMNILKPIPAPVVDVFYFTAMAIYEDHLKKLYDLGARKFAIVDVPTTGWTPAVNGLCRDCSAEVNALAKGFNDQTEALLLRLKGTKEDMNYSICSSYNLLSTVIANPEHYGFTNVDKACVDGATYCPDRDKYVFWDGAHPTDAMAKIAGSTFYNGSLEFASPVNLQKLAHEDANLAAY